MIFVQIASYRDPELHKTLFHLFDKSKFPEKINVGICNQYHPDDIFNSDLEQFRKMTNIRIIDIKYTESKGACWARSLVNTLYRDEQYTLQLDSHHRFSKHWDDKLLEMFHSINDENPILSTYPYSYFPDKEQEEYIPDNNSLQIVTDKFADHDGILILKPHHIYNHTTPIRARFLAGGFIFTYGRFIKDCPYDPNLYFLGEELTLAIRAFTHGYNIYHPHRNYIWHEYTRTTKSHHWDDIAYWNDMNLKSRERIKRLFEQKDDFGLYGFGDKRSFLDYQEFSGIDFKKRIIHPDVLDNKPPPIIKSNKFNNSYKQYLFNVNISDFYDRLQCVLDDNKKIEYIYTVIMSVNNNEVYRNEVLYHNIETHMCFDIDSNETLSQLIIILHIKDAFLNELFKYDLKEIL